MTTTSFKTFVGAEDRGNRSRRHRLRCFTLARARAEPLALVLKNMAEALAGGPSFFLLRSAAMGTKKGPASEEAGRIGFGGYSPLRRDQISV